MNPVEWKGNEGPVLRITIDILKSVRYAIFDNMLEKDVPAHFIRFNLQKKYSEIALAPLYNR